MTTINIRVEEKTKKAANKVFADLGLDMSTGVKMFLTQVAREKGLPFTPTTDMKAIVAKWDKEVEWALKHGKRYSSAEALLADLRQ
jgi:addiction module RelB/DinJ family antitoxin